MKSRKKASAKAATKNDVKRSEKALRGDMQAMDKALRVDMQAMGKELRGEIQDVKKEIFQYFDLKTEQLTHDFRDIFNDRTVQYGDQLRDHEQRLKRVEKNIGIAA